MERTFADTICKNIDWLGDAARRGDQAYVDHYLDNLFAFHVRVCGRSGLDPRPITNQPAKQKSLFDLAAE